MSQRQTHGSGRAALCWSSSDVGDTLYLRALNAHMGVLGSGYWDKSWDLEYDSKFCGRLVKWQEVRWDVFAVACAAEDTHCSFLCLFLCVQRSSLPKPEHRAFFSKSKLEALLMPPWPGSSLQHRYGRAECIHHAEIGSHVLTVSYCVTRSCLGSDLLFSPKQQQPLMRRGPFPPPAPWCLVTSKLRSEEQRFLIKQNGSLNCAKPAATC